MYLICLLIDTTELGINILVDKSRQTEYEPLGTVREGGVMNTICKRPF